MWDLEFKAKGLQLNVETAPSLSQLIMTDEGKLRQILLNILGNAVKFTQLGRVSLFAQLAKTADFEINQHYLLSVDIVDTGPGIKDTEIEQVFRTFA